MSRNVGNKDTLLDMLKIYNYLQKNLDILKKFPDWSYAILDTIKSQIEPDFFDPEDLYNN
jgi:hypothetical protein